MYVFSVTFLTLLFYMRICTERALAQHVAMSFVAYTLVRNEERCSWGLAWS